MICVDASLAAKWIFEEEHSERARALYRDSVMASERIIAPPLLPIEVTNIVRQRMRRVKPPAKALLSIIEAQEILEHFLAMPIEFELPRKLHQVALEVAVAHELTATYDAHYIALAQMLGCKFWTADRNLVVAMQEKLSFVRWIGEYEQGGK